MARYQNDLHNLNYNLIFQIKLELDSLTAYHEQILKACRKARYNVEHFDNQIMNPQKKDLMDAFQQQLIQNPYQSRIFIFKYHANHCYNRRISLLFRTFRSIKIKFLHLSPQ